MVYCFEDTDFARLVEIKRALYDDKPMAGDRRRDLANLMDAILYKAAELNEGDTI